MRTLLIGLLTLAFAVPSTARNATQPPSGLTIVDWSQIRAEYDRHRHTAFPDGDGFTARNREQQWNTRFDGRGFEIQPDQGSWSFGLELIGQGSARVTVHKNRVSYAWSPNLEEWFVNEARGLEHGFTIRQKSGPLDLRLAVRGELHAEGKGTGVRFVDVSGTAVVTYSELKAWDANGRALPSDMQAVGNQLHLFVDDRGAGYPITIDPVVQQAYLKPSGLGLTDLNDLFGSAVAVSDDTVVVGANQEASSSLGINGIPNETAPGAGAVFVFVRTAGVWKQQAYLKPAAVGTTQGNDSFGISVAISGDTVVVGARGEDSASLGVNSTPDESASAAGAAFVFVRIAGVWSQQAYLKPASIGTTAVADRFGWSVAVSGDTLVVGAPFEDSASLGVNSTQDENSPDAGAAYIFVRAGSVWSQQGYLKPSSVGTTQAGDRFGGSVAVWGDTVVVGAILEDSGILGVNGTANEGNRDAGASYVFARSGSIWNQQAFLKPAATGDNQLGDHFGSAVAVSDDTLVVGAPAEHSASVGVNSIPDENGLGAGAAYVFVRTGTVWRQQAFLKPAQVGTTQLNDSFGTSVAISGDTVVVGAPLESSASLGVKSVPNEDAPNAGTAYVFVRTAGVWVQQAYLKPTDVGFAQGGDNLGTAVAVSGDTIVAAAPFERSDSEGVNSTPNENVGAAGAAYTWLRSDPIVTEVMDAGSLRPEIAASAWVTIKGTGLASTTRIWVGTDFVQNRLPTTLDGVSVTIDGKPAAVYYISPTQLNVLSSALTSTGPVEVAVTTPQGNDTFTTTLKAQVPAWFLLDPESRKYVAAVNSDATIVGKVGLYPAASNFTKPLPARGRALIYGTGWGITVPAVPEGVAFSGAYPIAGATIRIGGIAVAVEFAGVVTPGLFQFNIVAPDLAPGDYLIEGSIGGVNTQAGAYITLGPPQ